MTSLTPIPVFARVVLDHRCCIYIDPAGGFETEKPASLDRPFIERQEEAVTYEMRLQELRPQAIVSVRLSTVPREIGGVLRAAIGRVGAFAEREGVVLTGPPVAIYHRFDEEGVDMEVGAPVAGPVPEKEGVGAGELPGGIVATTVHVGPYTTLGTAWQVLNEWIGQQGYEATGACWESYPTDPAEEPDPAKYVTELYQPLRS
jgi:AraC family transcriptional regulator